MEILFIVSTPKSGAIFAGLANAALRREVCWGAFFTNDGVCCLADPELGDVIARATQAIACAESWQAHMGSAPCPIELGSQTNNSRLVGGAHHIVSL